MSIVFKVKAKRLAGVKIATLVTLRKVGELALEETRTRARTQHRDSDGRALPAYRVKVLAPRRPAQGGRQSRAEAAEAAAKGGLWGRLRRLVQGTKWAKHRERVKARKAASVVPPAPRQQEPAEIFQQLRKLGGVNRKGDHWQGGTPIRYLPPEGLEVRFFNKMVGRVTKRRLYSAVPDKAGQVWGRHWDTAEEFLADNYGGSQVDSELTGKMWRDMKVDVKVGSVPYVVVGFKGGAGGKNAFAVLASIRAKKKAAEESGKKARALSSAQKALLTNSRGPDGKLTATNAQVWMGLTDGEMQRVVDELAKLDVKSLEEAPVEVRIIS